MASQNGNPGLLGIESLVVNAPLSNLLSWACRNAQEGWDRESGLWGLLRAGEGRLGTGSHLCGLHDFNIALYHTRQWSQAFMCVSSASSAALRAVL